MLNRARSLMGMPITVEVVDSTVTEKNIDEIFYYFEYVDNKFSTYKDTSEISKINKGEITLEKTSLDMQNVLKLSGETKKLTDGYFDIKTPSGILDPSGLVKGWAIYNAANILKRQGFKNYYIEAGGDIQVSGKNHSGKVWSVGIKNPFNQKEIVKVIYVLNKGVATSGTYIRGNHIYDPKNQSTGPGDIVSLTVVGPNIYEADRFATAAFAMGKKGINFIERLEGFEGYMIDKNKTATKTSGFNKYTHQNA